MKYIKPNTLMYINTLIHIVGATIVISSIVLAYRVIVWVCYV